MRCRASGGGHQNHWGGPIHLRHSRLAFCNVPSGLIVSLDRDLESFLNKVHKFPKPRAVFLKPLLVEPGSLIFLNGTGSFIQLVQHFGDSDGTDGHASLPQRCECILERCCHRRLDRRHGFRCSQRKFLFPCHRMSQRFPKCEHIGWRMCEESESIQTLREGKNAFQGEQTIGGLESRHATKGSRAQYRSSGLSSQSERHHPCCNCSSGPTGAAARSVLQIMWVACWGRCAIGKGGTLRLSQEDCPTLAQIARSKERRVG